MFKIKFQALGDTDKTIRAYKRAGNGGYQNSLIDLLRKAGWKVLVQTQSKYLVGESLYVRTNRLRSSIKVGRVERIGTTFGISAGTNVSYGRYWEEGFTIKPYSIFPKDKKALSFNDGNVVVKRVDMPGRTMAPRPWLMPSFEDVLPELKDNLAELAKKELSK